MEQNPQLPGGSGGGGHILGCGGEVLGVSILTGDPLFWGGVWLAGHLPQVRPGQVWQHERLRDADGAGSSR